MSIKIPNGTTKTIDDKHCIYYDGYWIKSYELKTDSLTTKKQLIDQLTRRVFHHVEPGINTPGYRLDEIRETYDNEKDLTRKRIKGAMLAGALLNRGSDILTAIVDLEESGVKIEQGNELLRECGRCLMEALEHGKHIKLSSGQEGLDELWGEPFKVFSMPMASFYETRYIKVAQTMSEIDQICERLTRITHDKSGHKKAEPLIKELALSAKLACETLRSDPVIFEVWPQYIAAKEYLEAYVYECFHQIKVEGATKQRKPIVLIKEGGELLANLSIIRVPMPKSTKAFLEKCDQYSSI